MSLERVRGLSLTRPWPWAFVNGPVPKRIENRSWFAPKSIISTHQIALHAAKSWDETDREFIADTSGLIVPPKNEHPDSIIFAVCRVSHCFEYQDRPGILNEDSQDIWSFGPVCWVIKDFVELVELVPCKGAQGLWGFDSKPLELAKLKEVYAASKGSVDV